MADKSVGELIAATTVGQTDLFVLEQNNVAKKLSGQTLMNDLAKMLDGHGGISSIRKTGTSGIKDIYTITYADTSTTTFEITNGNGIESAVLNGDYTLTLNFDDGTAYTTPSIRGAAGVSNYVFIKYASQQPSANGDMHDTPDDWMGIYSGTSPVAPTSYTSYTWYKIKGDNTYTYVRYASEEPNASTPIYVTPDKWMGLYVGPSPTAPSSYAEYQWYEIKGDKGDKGDTGSGLTVALAYGTSISATSLPTSWVSDPSSLALTGGIYLWTRMQYLDDADTIQKTGYAIGYIGINGTGSGTVTTITFGGITYEETNGDVQIPYPAPTAIGAVAEPTAKADKQVLTWDDAAGKWVAANPATGNVNTVDNVGVKAGTTDVPLGAVRYSAAQNLTTAQQAQAKGNIGLEKVNNTADSEKPVSTLQQNELNKKQAKYTAVSIPIAVADWNTSTLTCKKNVSGVTATNGLIVSPAASSFAEWGKSLVRATAQGAGTVTFTCKRIPSAAVTAQIMIWGDT